jgi:hypothetical protein
MLKLEETRQVQVLVNGQWVDAQWQQIEKGDVIRMFEVGTAELVKDLTPGREGVTAWIAGNNACLEITACSEDGVALPPIEGVKAGESHSVAKLLNHLEALGLELELTKINTTFSQEMIATDKPAGATDKPAGATVVLTYGIGTQQ